MANKRPAPTELTVGEYVRVPAKTIVQGPFQNERAVTFEVGSKYHSGFISSETINETDRVVSGKVARIDEKGVAIVFRGEFFTSGGGTLHLPKKWVRENVKHESTGKKAAT